MNTAVMVATWMAVAAPYQPGAAGATVNVGPLRFRPHRIDAFPGGYQVSVADMNADGLPDVIALAERPSALAWYEAPSWKKHPIDLPEAKQLIDVAPQEIDGDGRMDLALATDFELRNSATGLVHWLSRGKEGERWTLHRIDAEPTSHRIRWADVDGDGKRELVDIP